MTTDEIIKGDDGDADDENPENEKGISRRASSSSRI
jgi:hypothetical protein